MQQNKSQRNKEYHEANRSERIQSMKDNHKSNRPKRVQAMKKYHAQNKSKVLLKRKKSYLKKTEKRYKNFPFNRKCFFEEIQFGPIFPCICCNRDMFKRGVKAVTEDFLLLLNVLRSI